MPVYIDYESRRRRLKRLRRVDAWAAIPNVRNGFKENA